MNNNLKSLLIDDITHLHGENNEFINGVWYHARPIRSDSLFCKIEWCIEILRGKSIAIHFKSDEL